MVIEHQYHIAVSTYSDSFESEYANPSPTRSPASFISSRIEIRTSAHRSTKRRQASRFVLTTINDTKEQEKWKTNLN